MTNIVNGQLIIQNLEKKLLYKINQIKQTGLLKALGVIVTTDAYEIQTYINAKQEYFTKLNIPFIIARVKPKKQEVIRWISKFNKDPQIGGILLQLPLHDNIAKYQNEFLNLINSQKDIEGLSNINLGNLIQGNKAPLSPAVCGMIKALNYHKIDWQTKHWGIIGAGTIVGKPLVAFLTGKKVSFTIIDKNKSDYDSLFNADILVTATGTNMQNTVFKLIKKYQKNDLILLDAGTFYKNNEIHSDLDLPFNLNNGYLDNDLIAIFNKKIKLYTPRFNSLGPLTVFCLAKNFIDIV